MTYECAECNKRGNIEVVCHHCGKPLCRDHRHRIVDDAFSDATGGSGRTAWHCAACRRGYHPRAVEPVEVQAS